MPNIKYELPLPEQIVWGDHRDHTFYHLLTGMNLGKSTAEVPFCNDKPELINVINLNDKITRERVYGLARIMAKTNHWYLHAVDTLGKVIDGEDEFRADLRILLRQIYCHG